MSPPEVDATPSGRSGTAGTGARSESDVAAGAAGRSTTIGVTGLRRRWSVDSIGSVRPWGAGTVDPTPGSLDWYVAADDRWHTPAAEPTVRQRRVDGTPVLETRVRIPDGDAVQRVWAVPEGGGTAIVEFENSSPLPIAVAIHGESIVTERPPSGVGVDGIDLPSDTIVLPIGHHATVRVALGATSTVPGAAPWRSTVRGWTRVTEQASRFVLPDPAVAEAIVGARCDLLLEGPVDPDDDPLGFLLDVGELVRCGDDADAWLVDVVDPVARLLADRRRGWRRRTRESRAVGVELLDGLRAARRVALAADDARAVGDLDAALAELPAPEPSPPVSLAELRRSVSSGGPADPHRDSLGGDGSADRADVSGESVGRFVRRVERRFALDGDLLPGGVPSAWLGADFEVHGLPTGVDSTVGFAVRWHGERPAVLWEQRGHRVTLTASSVDPQWVTDDSSGESLWAVPANATLARRPISFTVEGVRPDGE